MSKLNGQTPPRDKGRFVALRHAMMDTPAWQSLNTVARSLYIELARRYRGPGTNNGSIVYSVREAAKALGIGKSCAAEAMQRLQDRGFIVVAELGEFASHGRQATRWRMTEFDCDVTGEVATMDFMRRAPPASPSRKPKPRPSLRERYS